MATLPGSSTPSRKVKEPRVQVLTVVMMSCVALIGNFLSWDTVLLLNWSPASKMIHLKGEKSEMNHAKIWTRYFTEEIIQMDSSHMKDYAASLIIRKPHSAHTILYRLKWLKWKRTASDVCELSWPAGGSVIGTSTSKTTQHFLWKLKMCIPYDPEIPLLGIPATEMHKRAHQKDKHDSIQNSIICNAVHQQ